MWDARLWWWSRAVEVLTVLACMIANRIPTFSKTPGKALQPHEIVKAMPLYVPWKGDK